MIQGLATGLPPGAIWHRCSGARASGLARIAMPPAMTHLRTVTVS